MGCGRRKGGLKSAPKTMLAAHMFVTSDGLPDGGALLDFGLLFHAKEYPREWRTTSWGPSTQNPRLALCSAQVHLSRR